MPNPLRIGVVIYGSPDQLSGGYLYDRILAAHLESCGWSVEFLSIESRGYYRSLFTSPLPVLKRLISEKGPFDFIIIDELCHPSIAFRTDPLKRYCSCPVILLVHHLRRNEKVGAVNRLIAAVCERNVIMNVDSFIFNSTSTEHEVRKLCARRHIDSAVIATPAGDRLVSKLSPAGNGGTGGKTIAQGGPLNVIFTGNIIARKGLHVLLHGLKLLCSGDNGISGVHLTVAGDCESDPAYFRNVRRIAERWSSLFKTEFTGRVDDDRLARLFECNHVLCVPSSFEGFGIVYLEGMYFGLPAIGTTGGGASDIIVNGKNGFLLPPGKSVPIAESLRRLAGDPALYERMSREALETASRSDSWEDSMERVRGHLISLHGKRNL